MPSRTQAAGFALLLSLLAPGSAAERIERVLAVVDDTPVLMSETLALQSLKPYDRDAALQALIDELLMLREAARLREAAASPEEQRRAYLDLVDKLQPGVPRPDEEALRRIAWRQTVILKYIELRFRPQIRIDDAELQRAHDEQYQGRPGAPPLAEVAQALGERLASRALDKRIEDWVAELRAAARIRVLPEPRLPDQP
jgi:hypothetical protein